jgi:hypothetical protein
MRFNYVVVLILSDGYTEKRFDYITRQAADAWCNTLTRHGLTAWVARA